MNTKRDSYLLWFGILTAYLFSVLFHVYWVYWASHFPQFLWHSQVMINNPDGYFYGSDAQKILYHVHQYNPRLENPWIYGTSVITAFISRFFHISLDTVMLYMSAFVSSLMVIPIMFIGKLYKNITWGFLAALIGSIGWSYYNRTLAGYYGTDMVSFLIPVFIIYFLLKSYKTADLKDVFIAVIIGIFYPWLYGSGNAVLYSIVILYMVFVFVFGEKDFKYKSIILISLSLLHVFILIKLLIAAILFVGLKYINLNAKQWMVASVIAFFVFLFGTNMIFIILKPVLSYTATSKNISGLHFFNVAKTVREAGHIPWFIVFDRIIGSTIGIVIAVIGYLFLLKKHKEFVIALPLWGIGFFAFVGGLRFTAYAVPIAAISGVYFFVFLTETLKNKKLKIAVPVLGSLFILAPNISHIVGCCAESKILQKIAKIYPLSSRPYLTPTVFNKNEVEVLDELRKKSNPKDYVITWWDYGYPIWYYVDVNTLIDGGKHHEDNFIVSKILTTSNQTLAYNLAKISIKKYVETNKTVAPQIFIKNGKPVNVSEYLMELGQKKVNVKLDRNVYLMFPFRMFNIFPTVSIFSNRNINTGEQYPEHLFFKGRISQRGNILFIGRIPVDLQRGMVLAKNPVPVKRIYLVAYDKAGRLVKKVQTFNQRGVDVVILESYGIGMLMDDYYLNSTFVQMFVFENYNRKLYEPVIMNPFMKIYKLK